MNIRPYRLGLLMLVAFAVGAVMGCWRTEVMNARLHTCAVCEQPLDMDLAHGHRDCYLSAFRDSQAPVLAEMQARWQGAALSAEERSERSAVSADPGPGRSTAFAPALGFEGAGAVAGPYGDGTEWEATPQLGSAGVPGR